LIIPLTRKILWLDKRPCFFYNFRKEANIKKFFYLLFILFPIFLIAEKEIQQKEEYDLEKTKSSIIRQKIKKSESNKETKLDDKKGLAYKNTIDNKKAGIHINWSKVLDIAQFISYVVISLIMIYLFWKERTSTYRNTLYSLQLKGYSNLASLMKKIILYIYTYPYVVQKAKEGINELQNEQENTEKQLEEFNNEYANMEKNEKTEKAIASLRSKGANIKRKIENIKKDLIEKTMQYFFEEDFNIEKGKKLFLYLFNEHEPILPKELAGQFENFLKKIPYNDLNIPSGKKLKELQSSIEEAKNKVYKEAERHFHIKALTQTTRNLIKEIEISKEVEKLKADQNKS